MRGMRGGAGGVGRAAVKFAGAAVVFALAFVLICPDSALAQLKKRKEVSIGYMLNYNPWKLAVSLGTFERVTGYTIKWMEIKDSFKATVALGSNEVELVVANSADIARAFSRHMAGRLIYITEEVDNSEALLIHPDWHASNGGPIRSPRDLIGHEVYVNYGSTAHYSLCVMLKQMQLNIIHDTTYKRGEKCTLRPCHVPNAHNSVTIIGLSNEDILKKWWTGNLKAAYVGLPELNVMKHNATILFTNRLTAQWDKPTFSGLIASNEFLDRLNPKYATYNVETFIQMFISEMAKSNYYYENNTKEFGAVYKLDTIGTQRVSGAIASVTGGSNEAEVFQQLILRRYPSLKDQLSCKWMGCGDRGRVARSLKDQAEFFLMIKADNNKPKKSTQDVSEIKLAETLKSYSKFVDVSYMQTVWDAGVTGAYPLTTGQFVHTGYTIMTMFGPTRSLMTS